MRVIRFTLKNLIYALCYTAKTVRRLRSNVKILLAII